MKRENIKKWGFLCAPQQKGNKYRQNRNASKGCARNRCDLIINWVFEQLFGLFCCNYRRQTTVLPSWEFRPVPTRSEFELQISNSKFEIINKIRICSKINGGHRCCIACDSVSRVWLSAESMPTNLVELSITLHSIPGRPNAEICFFNALPNELNERINFSSFRSFLIENHLRLIVCS